MADRGVAPHLTPFEALHLVRAARAALVQEADAVLEAAAQEVLRANGAYLEQHPDELAEVERLIEMSQELKAIWPNS